MFLKINHSKKTEKMRTAVSPLIILALFIVQTHTSSVTNSVADENYNEEDSRAKDILDQDYKDEDSKAKHITNNEASMIQDHINGVEYNTKLKNDDNIKSPQENHTEDTVTTKVTNSINLNSANGTDKILSNKFVKEYTYSEDGEYEWPCVGQRIYCNMSRTNYTRMMNNFIAPHTYEWILIGTHTVVFVIGLVGNALVCAAVYRNHKMRTVTNYFIVNLAVADFLVILLCLPPTVVWNVTQTWFFGQVPCKLVLYSQSVSVTVSVLTLTFISVDRWYAICYPLKPKSNKSRAKTAMLIIWAVALIYNIPELVVLETVRSEEIRFQLPYLTQCKPSWTDSAEIIWHVLRLVFIYTIPVLLMTVAHTQIVKVLWKNKKIPGQAETMKLAPAEKTQLRSRRKAAKMLVAVIIMFAICYLPVHLLNVLRYTMLLKQSHFVTFVAMVSHALCYANSAINPLIYNFMCGTFRREFRRSCCSGRTLPDNFSTLSRVTTSKVRQQSMPLTYQPPHVCTTTLVENGYKKGSLT